MQFCEIEIMAKSFFYLLCSSLTLFMWGYYDWIITVYRTWSLKLQVCFQACVINNLPQDSRTYQSFLRNLLMDNRRSGWWELLCLTIFSPSLDTDAFSVGLTLFSPYCVSFHDTRMYNSLYVLCIYNEHLYCFYTGTQSKVNELL